MGKKKKKKKKIKKNSIRLVLIYFEMCRNAFYF